MEISIHQVANTNQLRRRLFRNPLNLPKYSLGSGEMFTCGIPVFHWQRTHPYKKYAATRSAAPPVCRITPVRLMSAWMLHQAARLNQRLRWHICFQSAGWQWRAHALQLFEKQVSCQCSSLSGFGFVNLQDFCHLRDCTTGVLGFVKTNDGWRGPEIQYQQLGKPNLGERSSIQPWSAVLAGYMLISRECLINFSRTHFIKQRANICQYVIQQP